MRYPGGRRGAYPCLKSSPHFVWVALAPVGASERVSDALAFVPPDYALVRQLGSGQTSHVFLARHPQRGEVALKLPRKELHDQPVLRRMFENEVQITIGLSDAHVVRAIDGHPTGERAFLVLEYCSGGTLDQLLLEKGRLSVERASALILDVAQGLWVCHKQQVLHRDVKPANVFLTGDGRAKLGDFGTGIFMTDPKRLDERVGTAFYMAPELFEGQPSDFQGDIYSLGVLAYEVLSGVRPFVGNSYDELMLQHRTSLPRNLHSVRSDISPDLNRVIVRAMSRDASKRFANVGDFIRAFSEHAGVSSAETVKTGSGSGTGRSSRSPTRELPITRTTKKDEPSGPFNWFKRKKK